MTMRKTRGLYTDGPAMQASHRGAANLRAGGQILARFLRENRPRDATWDAVMNARAERTWDDQGDAEQSGPLSIRETSWGFIVSDLPGQLDVGLVEEASLKFFGLVMILAAGVQWLVPGTLYGGNVLLAKFGMMAMFGLVGFALFRHANRGYRAELHVDAAHREVRIATRNSRGQARARKTFAMRDIEECFVDEMAEGAQGTARLCFRVSGEDEPVRIATAPQTDLVPVLERLVRDLTTPRARTPLHAA